MKGRWLWALPGGDPAEDDHLDPEDDHFSEALQRDHLRRSDHLRRRSEREEGHKMCLREGEGRDQRTVAGGAALGDAPSPVADDFQSTCISPEDWERLKNDPTATLGPAPSVKSARPARASVAVAVPPSWEREV